MTKQILDVGNCAPDLAMITDFLTGRFDCAVTQTHGPEDTLAELGKGDYDLVLVNRKLDRDSTDGIEIIKAIKADGRWSDLPVMLVTNLPEHQDAATAIGAERGFGKLELNDPTAKRLEHFLG